MAPLAGAAATGAAPPNEKMPDALGVLCCGGAPKILLPPELLAAPKMLVPAPELCGALPKMLPTAALPELCRAPPNILPPALWGAAPKILPAELCAGGALKMLGPPPDPPKMLAPAAPELCGTAAPNMLPPAPELCVGAPKMFAAPPDAGVAPKMLPALATELELWAGAAPKMFGVAEAPAVAGAAPNMPPTPAEFCGAAPKILAFPELGAAEAPKIDPKELEELCCTAPKMLLPELGANAAPKMEPEELGELWGTAPKMPPPWLELSFEVAPNENRPPLPPPEEPEVGGWLPNMLLDDEAETEEVGAWPPKMFTDEELEVEGGAPKMLLAAELCAGAVSKMLPPELCTGAAPKILLPSELCDGCEGGAPAPNENNPPPPAPELEELLAGLGAGCAGGALAPNENNPLPAAELEDESCAAPALPPN